MGRLSGTDLVCFLLAFRGYCSAKRLKEYVHVDEEHEELFERLLEPR